jgi:drug/metabolite transporter (DMT)-like permease
VGALTAVTAIWGWSFLLVKDAVAGYPVFPFLAIRFSLATLLVLPFLRHRLRLLDRGSLLGGVLMGTALFSGYALQTTGLLWTSAANSGFITGLFVVLTPLFESILLRRLPRIELLGAVTLSTAGLAVLSLQGGGVAVNVGDLLSLCCAAVYAVHLLLTSHMARRHDTGVLVIVQVATVSILAWLFSVPSLPMIWPIPRPTWTGIIVTAVFATALAYYVQTTFQRHLSALQTALIFTLEPVFAGAFAVLLGGEHLGWRGLGGGALILVGMLTGQWAEQRRSRH